MDPFKSFKIPKERGERKKEKKERRKKFNNGDSHFRPYLTPPKSEKKMKKKSCKVGNMVYGRNEDRMRTE